MWEGYEKTVQKVRSQASGLKAARTTTEGNIIVGGAENAREACALVEVVPLDSCTRRALYGLRCEQCVCVCVWVAV